MQYKDENGVNEPPRRRLLRVIGALALAGSCPAAHVQKTQSAPDMFSPDVRSEKQLFCDKYRTGVLMLRQVAIILAVFDVLASDKTDLERLFHSLVQRFAFLTQGEAAPETPNPCLPPLDSGILGGYIASDNFTIMLSVGHSLFDERFGLTPQIPKKLRKMTCFPNGPLDAVLCRGDVLLQICANTQGTVIHALRDIIKRTLDLLSVRWEQGGFVSDHMARSKGREAPINLLDFKDGTASSDSQNDKLIQKVVWVTTDQQEPAWAVGDSYQTVCLIQFRMEFWDRTPLKEQQTILGRDKQTGAPLGMQHEHDVPDYISDSEGEVIALDSHIQLANPRTVESKSSLMLRRSYSYSLDVTNSGRLDMGLLLVYYQHDLEKGFLVMQKRLSDEALEEYVKPIGDDHFFALPGVKDVNDYFGSALLRT